MENPYREALLEILPATVEEAQERKEERVKLCWQYSWSLPSEEAIETLVKQGPLVELGAGTGYWAWMVRQAGGDIASFDANPPGLGDNNRWHDKGASWTEVKRGSLAILDEHTDRTLMLCWPPYSDQKRSKDQLERRKHLRNCMAYQALRRWQGQKVVYIGEWRCCTGGWAFHDLLETQWLQVDELPLLAWPGIEDRVRVFERLEFPVTAARRPGGGGSAGGRGGGPAGGGGGGGGPAGGRRLGGNGAVAPAAPSPDAESDQPRMQAIPLPALYEPASRVPI